MAWCKNPDRGLPNPDVVFYLDISIKDAQTRGSFGDERYEKVEFQERVADIYKQLRSNDWKVNTVFFSYDNSKKAKMFLLALSEIIFLLGRAAVEQAKKDKDMIFVWKILISLLHKLLRKKIFEEMQ